MGGLPRPKGCHGRQGRCQVGAVGYVQLHVPRSAQLERLVRDRPVPLGGIGVQPGGCHRISQASGGKPERRLGPVGFHDGAGRPVGLVPLGVVLGGQGHGDGKLHPEMGHGLEGHLDIPLALQGGGGDEHRRAAEQGQGEEQAAEKLGGHIPWKAVLPRREGPGDGEHAVLLLVEDALRIKQIEIGLQGPVHEPPPAGEPAAPPDRQSDGDQEAQGGAALPAVQAGIGQAPQGGHGVGSHAPDGDGGAVHGELRPQLLQAPEGGPDVLGEGHVGDRALPMGQGGGDEQAVGLGFGGRRGDGPG